MSFGTRHKVSRIRFTQPAIDSYREVCMKPNICVLNKFVNVYSPQPLKASMPPHHLEDQLLPRYHMSHDTLFPSGHCEG